MKLLAKQSYRLVDYFRKTDARGVFNKLRQSQLWDKEKLDNHQFDLYKKLLIHCKENVPYYANLFQKVGFDPKSMANVKDAEVIPILTKELIRQNYADLYAKDFDKYKPRPKTTGGSTGEPITVYLDFASHSYFAASNLRVWNVASSYTIGDRFITVAHGSLLPKNNTLKNKVYFFLQNSELITSYHLNDDRLSAAIECIKRSKAKHIYGYSSSIYLIAKYAKANNIRIKSGLKAVITTSDMLYQNQRELIEKVFGVKVFDSYGCPESGLISFECEYHNGYHLNQESSFVEIISPDEKGLGKIISTPLYSYAFPLIRYDTGDVGKISYGRCDCGCWLPKVTELGGRIRDFVILEDGRYIHGAFFNHFSPFYKNDWMGEYQVIQEDYDRLLIKVNTRRTPTDDDKEIIRKELRKGLLNDLKIEFDLGGVEYTKGGKFRLIISKVKTKWDL